MRLFVLQYKNFARCKFILNEQKKDLMFSQIR